jgi:hypothetical protein
MASKTTQSANDVLNYMLRGTAPSWGGSSTLYLSLHTGAVGLGGNQQSNEATYTGYARVALTRSAGGAFTAASSGSSSNNALVLFGLCTGGTLPETLTHVSIGENASGAGTVIATGALNSPLVVNLNSRPEFDVSTLVVQEQ